MLKKADKNAIRLQRHKRVRRKEIHRYSNKKRQGRGNSYRV